MGHTGPMRFAREVWEETVPQAQRRTLPEPEKVAVKPVKKEVAIPGCWRSQRRLSQE
jgi:hypothetical protein